MQAQLFRLIILFITSIMVSSCASSTKIISKKSYQIKFLDEYVLYNDSIFKNSKIGGLSGIEYNKKENTYYIICDDARNPRLYTAKIAIENNSFSAITIDPPVTIKDSTTQFINNNTLDLEAIRLLDNNKLILTSEGNIKKNYPPAIFITDLSGNYLTKFKLPSYFLIDSVHNKPRHNGVFEGLTNDIKNKGYWAAMELPLELDGEEPTINNGGAPIRITHFNTATKQANDQFTYPLDKLARDPKGKFGVNGATGLIQLNDSQFLIIERAYSAGYGTQGNTVRLYLADKKNTTNTLDFVSLQENKHTPATKTLLFDFESIRNQLTNNIVDNIEGITLGPKLPNGNQSLILVADNNFNPTSIQMNQFILLELIKKP